MAKNSIINAIRDFIEKYEGLKAFEGIFPLVQQDTLEENETAYMVESVPCEPIVKQWVDGTSIRRVVFAFCSREYYGDAENRDTSEFYEDFALWLEKCTKEKNFPMLPEGCEAKSIKATTPGYLYDAKGKKAQYRIQCEFQYYKK